jgi:hypothetical protein
MLVVGASAIYLARKRGTVKFNAPKKNERA